MKRILFIAVLACSLAGLISQEIRVPARGYPITVNSATNVVIDSGSALTINSLLLITGNGELVFSNAIGIAADELAYVERSDGQLVGLAGGTAGQILTAVTTGFAWSNTVYATTTTNSQQAYILGSIQGFSNIIVQVGGSNTFVGGTLFQSMAQFTNLNSTSATFTNLGNTTVGAHTLTNNGDGFRAIWSGRMTNGVAVPNTNEFKIVFGSTTILDTGLQPSTNIPFYAWVEVTRTGNTAQHADAHFEWGPGGGIPWAFTNVNMELAETNGIATVLALQGASTIKAAHTNTFFKVSYIPASR